MSKIAWNDINWTLVQKRISRQQRRVYKASMEGNKAKVHAIQRRIIASLDARLLAIRQITTENKGCNTAGVDNIKVISHKKKIELAYRLKLDGKATPIRRNCIPTLEDQAKQMLAKLALEPEWEAIFEYNSYGFRPGRSCHDAIATVSLSLSGKPRYVLDTDIQKCFNRINHDKLLKKLSTFDLMKNQIKAWLRVDTMVGYLNRPDEVKQAMEGTPQGDIISPLLANIALHGLGDHIKNWYANTYYQTTERNSKVEKDRMTDIGFARYADNFVITAPEQVAIIEIKKQVAIWLNNEVGLKLSKAKTRIINSTQGFEFLGFQIISVKQSNRVYQVKTRPSRRSRARIIQLTRDIIQRNKSASSFYLITLLTSRIIGWANYFRYSECSKDFSKLDYLIFNQVRAWVFRRKSKGLKSRTALKLKYFPEGKTYRFRGKDYKNNWILTGNRLTKDGKLEENFLPKMVWISTAQHVKIRGKASPYDGNHLYWAKREEKYSGFNERVSKLIRIQNGCCAKCGRSFALGDSIEVNYIILRPKRRLDKYKKLQVLHKHCQIQKSHFENSVSIK